MHTAADYRAEAARCRRLANGFWRANDPTARLLLEMALEFDGSRPRRRSAAERVRAARARRCWRSAALHLSVRLRR
jgi:hypothetical protein